MRIGQKNGLVYQWAKKGTRPRQPKDQRYANAYLFGAISAVRMLLVFVRSSRVTAICTLLPVRFWRTSVWPMGLPFSSRAAEPLGG